MPSIKAVRDDASRISREVGHQGWPTVDVGGLRHVHPGVGQAGG
jgi:hypothetical protein